MYGIALEGGGMKGAYHIGAIKAILECGYNIGGYVGTSIGAFNAAVLAQGDFNKLYDMWYNGSAAMGFDVEENQITKVISKKMDVKTIKYWTQFFKNTISNKGIDTEKLKALYDTTIDEEKLRKSKLDYGLVTVSLTDKKTIYMCKEDIPKGLVSTYVLASSNLPVFKQSKLLDDDKTYIDGGFIDNCPITILKNKGYKDIIEIRTKAIGVYKKVNRKNLNVITITASKDLGSVLFSDNITVRNNIKMGYFDALRVIKKYIGDKFYVIPNENDNVFEKILNIPDEKILNIVKKIKVPGVKEDMEPKKILFEKILPYISSKLKNKDTTTYQKLLIAMMEYVTEDEIEVYKLYTFDELLQKFKKKIPHLMKKEKEAIIKNNINMLILEIIKNIE